MKSLSGKLGAHSLSSSFAPDFLIDNDRYSSTGVFRERKKSIRLYPQPGHNISLAGALSPNAMTLKHSFVCREWLCHNQGWSF